MQAGAGRTFAYDVENKPITITNGSSTVNMYYDGNGNRVKKVSGANTTIYIGGMYECTNGNCEKYIFANGNRIAKVAVASTTVNYYHSDHLGSSSIITDGAGNKVETTTYYPYGETRSDVGTVNVKHKFTGQEYDAETGLYFYGARYYDPVLGRFISPDTIVPNPYNPQTLNRYSYCLNNPLKYTDPSGHIAFWDDLFWAVVSSGLEYLCKLYNHNQDPKHYPAPNFSFGISIDNTGAMSGNINGIPFDFGGSPWMGYGEDKRPINDPGMSVWGDLETTINVILTLIRFPEAGATSKGLATKGGEILDAAAEMGNSYGIIAKNEKTLATEGKLAGTEITFQIGSKIEGQMIKRDWTNELIKDTINNPTKSLAVTDTRYLPGGIRLNEPATAYFRADGSYVVRNNTSGDIVQISNRLNPNWKASHDK